MNSAYGDLANLIMIRNFLLRSVEDINVKLSREQVKAIQSRVVLLNEKIINGSLSMTVTDVNEPKTVHTVVATENMDVTMQKIQTVLDAMKSPEKPKTTKPAKKPVVSRVSDQKDDLEVK